MHNARPQYNDKNFLNKFPFHHLYTHQESPLIPLSKYTIFSSSTHNNCDYLCYICCKIEKIKHLLNHLDTLYPKVTYYGSYIINPEQYIC